MKWMSTRNAVIGFLAAVLLAFLAFALLGSIRSAESEEKERVARYALERQTYDETVGAVVALAGSATTLADWELVRIKAQSLPEPAKKHFTQLAQVESMELLTDERDRLLANAGALFGANENDPGVKENIAKALLFHERADALVQKLEHAPGNAAWNKSLQYRKAYEKYRSLAFLDKKEHGKALEIIDDALRNLKKGLDAAPKDNRIELAIEFLYKRAKEEDAQALGSGQGTGRPRAFPTERGNQGGPGTGGQFRPRQH